VSRDEFTEDPPEVLFHSMVDATAYGQVMETIKAQFREKWPVEWEDKRKFAIAKCLNDWDSMNFEEGSTDNNNNNNQQGS
jgi:hypothetical protein